MKLLPGEEERIEKTKREKRNENNKYVDSKNSKKYFNISFLSRMPSFFKKKKSIYLFNIDVYFKLKREFKSIFFLTQKYVAPGAVANFFVS